MAPIPGTEDFWLRIAFPNDARLEYKLVVDSTWILDPLNRRTAPGGFGENSELRMPGALSTTLPSRFPKGNIDSLTITEPISGTVYPLYVYTPPSSRATTPDMPIILVTDGGEYLSLAGMNLILDSLISVGAMPPTVAAFIDPWTLPQTQMSNKRMIDYAMNDHFVAFLAESVIPLVEKRCKLNGSPKHRAALGASMGGLTATYAVLQRPDVFGVAIAQSPSYWWNKGAILPLAARSSGVRFLLETGTIRDAQVKTREMRAILAPLGELSYYREVSQSHNWMHWRSTLPDLLHSLWTKP
jgi:enterochelin esterase family protein